MIKSFRKISVKDPDLTKVQDGLILTINTIIQKEVLDGVLAEDLEITTAPQQIAHGLGRLPLGYFIVSKNTFADIKDTARDTRTITLTASTDVTASLWFF